MLFGRTEPEHRDHRIYFRGIGVPIDKGVGDAIIIDKYRDERARTQLRKGAPGEVELPGPLGRRSGHHLVGVTGPR